MDGYSTSKETSSTNVMIVFQVLEIYFKVSICLKKSFHNRFFFCFLFLFLFVLFCFVLVLLVVVVVILFW